MSLITMRGVTKTFPGAAGAFHALSGVSLDIDAGEFVAVVGPSGSGKSTLLAGIDRAAEGEVRVGGSLLNAMNERALAKWRGLGVGIVFQFFQLLPTLTAVENVMLPMDFCNRWPARERPDRAAALLARLGVADQADKFPAAMSGGQLQRVAVARAMANAPPLLLADEPTGNLDTRNAEALLDILAGLVRDDGITVVMVTHERTALRHATRTIALVDGRIDEEAHA
jgi:putative ABC transport system ATP-binding protein